MDTLGIIGAVTGVAGAVTGAAGLVIAIFLTRWQDKVHKKEMAEERENHAKEIAEERAENQRLNRLAFLSDRIFDTSIPKELRVPFYEEYISMKGNGTAVKFWQLEEARERAAAAK